MSCVKNKTVFLPLHFFLGLQNSTVRVGGHKTRFLKTALREIGFQFAIENQKQLESDQFTNLNSIRSPLFVVPYTRSEHAFRSCRHHLDGITKHDINYERGKSPTFTVGGHQFLTALGFPI